MTGRSVLRFTVNAKRAELAPGIIRAQVRGDEGHVGLEALKQG